MTDIVPQDTTPRKKCTGPCGQSLPATTQYFCAKQHGKYGVAATCKDCEKAKRNAPEKLTRKREYDKSYRAIPEVRERKNAQSSAYEQTPQRQAWLKGYRSRPEVRTHKRVYHREYYRHYVQKPGKRTKILVRQSRYRKRPYVQAAQRCYTKAYYGQPGVKERMRVYERTVYSNPEKREHRRARARANYHSPNGQARYRTYTRRPDVYAKILTRNANRRAYVHASQGSHTVLEWENLKRQYNSTCLRCGKREPEIKLTRDHIIPITKGGSNWIENIQPLCFSCNASKKTQIIDYRPELHIEFKHGHKHRLRGGP